MKNIIAKRLVNLSNIWHTNQGVQIRVALSNIKAKLKVYDTLLSLGQPW